MSFYGGLMAVKISPMERGSRDSYWNATQEELQSVKRRGDFLVVGIAGALILAALLVRDRYSSFELWLATAGTVAVVIVTGVWFVVSRTRRIVAARGLTCEQCHYVPHDTEVVDVLSSRRCPRCEAEL
jgi:hypothetical protein